MLQLTHSQPLRYGFAVLAVLVTLLLKLLLSPLIATENSFFLFGAAVVVSAWYGGLEAGLLATTLTALVSDYFFFPPIYSFLSHTLEQTLSLAVFLLEGGLISWIVAALYSAKQQSETYRLTLQKSEEQLRQIAENISQVIWMSDPEVNQIFYVNPMYEEMWGRTTDSLYEQPNSFLHGIHPEDRDRILAAREKQTRGEYDEQYRIVRPDGSIRWVRSRVFPIRNEAGQVYRLTGIVEDITEQKQIETELRRANERFQLAATAVNCVIYDWDIEQNQVERTQGLVQLLGYYPDEVESSRDWWSTRIHPDDLPHAYQQMRNALQANSSYDIEYRVRHKQGHYLYVSDRGTIVRNVQGQAVRVVGCTLDLSDRKRAEEEIQRLNRELEHRVTELQTLFDVIPLGIAIAQDPECRFVHLNPFFQQMLGLAPDVNASKTGAQAETLPYKVLRDGREIPGEELPMQVAVKRGVKISNLEVQMVRSDGATFDLLGHAIPLFNEQEAVRGCLSVFMDITERKRTEQERLQLLASEQEARRQAEAASRLKDEFLAIVSHELRSPLNAILGWSRLLRTRQLDPVTTSRALEAIERNAQAQAQLIEDLLDISRIIRGKVRLYMRPVNLVQVIEAALDTVQLTADAKMIQLESRLDSNVGLVSGDPDRLQQIVWNLLSNAIKFTPQGGRVEVRVERVGMQAQIQVIDTGKGISPDFLPYIFDRFRQADSTTTRTHGGLGLGLAIVRNLVELHGGTIQAESQGEGQGATFTVALPLIAHPSPMSHLERGSTQRQVGLDDFLELNGLRVLIVDDEIDAREFLVTTLKMYGAQVTAAASASEAFELLEQLKPDVLVSDIGMPVEDGYTLIRKIRALAPEQGGRIPAAALTAFARQEDRYQALSAGFQKHVTKPIEPRRLIEVVASLASRS